MRGMKKVKKTLKKFEDGNQIEILSGSLSNLRATFSLVIIVFVLFVS